ncbi:MAG: aminotransferase class I/II-fold pyridoxal phosphate-dependent enzyme [Helicobacteraceae bacterium]|nr:aminotransferase class I/II-fold pyridoxal phosphate-dependent enzyme [Candidatus Sulfurimonas ponti]
MKHGANIYKYAKKLGCEPHEIIDFSSNINTHTLKPNIELSDELIVKYGDSSYKNLKKTIASKYFIKKKQVALFNGASSAIFELFKSLKEKRVYLYAPLYGEYEKAAQQTNKEIIKINRYENIQVTPKKNSIVVFVNPSTPDGKHYTLDKLLKIWEKQNCTIILDESFLEFESLPSSSVAIHKNKYLYIVKSFTKFHSCAGVRIGAIFSHQKNIRKLQHPLWHLSSFDTQFLLQRLQDTSFEEKSKKVHKKQKKELYKILKNAQLFETIYKSDANFFLVKTKHATTIFKQLLKNKILIRTCDSFDFLNKDYLRFAVKDKKAHKTLKQELHNALS